MDIFQSFQSRHQECQWDLENNTVRPQSHFPHNKTCWQIWLLRLSMRQLGQTPSRLNVAEPPKFPPNPSYRLKCRVISMPTNLFSIEGKNCQKMEANFQRSESHAANLDLTWLPPTVRPTTFFSLFDNLQRCLVAWFCLSIQSSRVNILFETNWINFFKAKYSNEAVK